jgi:hypothetical protein
VDSADSKGKARLGSQLGSQAQPVEISSSDENSDSERSDCDSDEPRRSGRVRRPTRAIESQQWQVEHGLVLAPGAKTKARALNKKKEKSKTSQLDHEFRLIK